MSELDLAVLKFKDTLSHKAKVTGGSTSKVFDYMASDRAKREAELKKAWTPSIQRKGF